MRIAVCDDDSSFLAHAVSLLELWGEGRIELAVECFSDGDALARGHAASAFDIILLDIVMPMADGIEVAREIRTSDKEVKLVFLTSSSDFAVQSYTVKASNYLLKPIDAAALFHCLNELEEEMRESARTIAVKGPWTVHRVRLASIEYLEACDKRVRLVLADGGVIESIETFRSLEDRLSLDDGFFKCHRSYIVNINCIGTYSSREIVMRTGQKIPVSRNCQAEFKDAYFSVIFGKDGDGM